MDVRRLRILREFADRGTVGEVADAMSLTPSAVSQQLKVLTREAGVPLLRQDGRGIALTEAGHALVLRADEVIAAVDRAGRGNGGVPGGHAACGAGGVIPIRSGGAAAQGGGGRGGGGGHTPQR